jgi:chemotaxis protein CheC
MELSTLENNILTQDEREILQEIMNIAFGKSAADLADVIDAHVELSIPFIKSMQIPDLPEYIRSHVKDYKLINIVEQKFWGKFRGDAILVFSSGAGKALIKMLQSEESKSFNSEPIDILESETLMEVGNILIGACVGKLAALLKDIVSYTPPMVLVEKEYSEAISRGHYEHDKNAIVLKTDFSFDTGNVSGFLFLVTTNESLMWLKESLNTFMDQYE